MDLRPAGWLAILTLVAMLAPLLAGSSAAVAQTQSARFSDVPQDAYYALPVAALADGGAFVGTLCEDGFCPHEPIDRKTAAVWVVRVIDGQDPGERDPDDAQGQRFDDVDPDSFYAPFIERLAEQWLTFGCGDGIGFCPNQDLSRAQAAVMLDRMWPRYRFGLAPDPGFSDVPTDAWYHQEVAELYQDGVTVGCGDGSRFCPDGATTRAQMATMLYRLRGPIRPVLKTLKWHSAGDSYSSGTGVEPYHDNRHGCRRSHWAYGQVAARKLLDDHDWLIGSHQGAEDITAHRADETDHHTEIAFSACHGRMIEHFFESHRHDGAWQDSLWPSNSERVDILTMSFGGNDVGFSDIFTELGECADVIYKVFFSVVPEECTEFYPPTEDNVVIAIGNRMNHLLHPPETNCAFPRHSYDLPKRYRCDLDIKDGERGGLDDFYLRVAEDLLTDDGILYVVGYPQFVADYDDWLVECQVLAELFDELIRRLSRVLSFNPGEYIASVVSQLTVKLNDTITAAIRLANLRLSGDRSIKYLDVHSLYRDGSHENCGTGELWMHGIASDGTALHPNTAGHKATGEALADLIARTHPYADVAAAHKAALAEYDRAFSQYQQYLRNLRSSS